MGRTHALIENNQVRFVFLHLPVPHPPGIYDRQRHLLRSGGTYLDNMVLADDSLGELLQEIDATPSASQTTVIVSSGTPGAFLSIDMIDSGVPKKNAPREAV